MNDLLDNIFLLLSTSRFSFSRSSLFLISSVFSDIKSLRTIIEKPLKEKHSFLTSLPGSVDNKFM
jgi:hypothetical protein